MPRWLTAQQVTHVAMEATGVYWKPVWHVLKGHVTLVLADAMHIRNIPGRISLQWSRVVSGGEISLCAVEQAASHALGDARVPRGNA